MDRGIVYPASLPQDTDILWISRRAMIAVGYLAQAAFGQNTVVDGLACTPTIPASLTVNVGPGSILTMEVVDASPFGSLPADNTDPLAKMGINITMTPLTLTAPGTSGDSINYLIEATFEETTNTPVVLPYYNSSNPSQPFSGPANSGTVQNTLVQQLVSLQAKAGVAAPTGTQTTPTVDAGYTGLYVVTVTFGQTQITNASIALYAGAPFVGGVGGPSARGVQPGRLLNTQTFAAAGTFAYTPTPGTNSIVVEMVGGGGSGGGSAATGASTVAAGSGGGGGGYSRRRVTSGFTGLNVIVGAGGAAPAAGTAGNNGGTSSLGSLISASGGGGGTLGNAFAVSGAPEGSAGGGLGASGDINAAGEYGLYALYSNPPTSGAGGGSFFGAGALWATAVNTAINGNPAQSPGSGGSGAAGALSQAAQSGGAGAAGLVTIREYS